MLHIADKVMGVRLDNSVGHFEAGVYRTENDGVTAEHILLYININQVPCNLRINSACYTGDIFGDSRCDCNWQLRHAIEYIHQQQQGLVIYHMHHEGRANGILEKLRSYEVTDRLGITGKKAYESIGCQSDARLYGSSVLILKDLGIQSVNLISNSPDKKRALEQNGIVVYSMIPVKLDSPEFAGYYQWKREDFNHSV